MLSRTALNSAAPAFTPMRNYEPEAGFGKAWMRVFKDENSDDDTTVNASESFDGHSDDDWHTEAIPTVADKSSASHCSNEDIERSLEPHLPGMGDDPDEHLVDVDADEGKRRGTELLSMLSDFSFGEAKHLPEPKPATTPTTEKKANPTTNAGTGRVVPPPPGIPVPPPPRPPRSSSMDMVRNAARSSFGSSFAGVTDSPDGGFLVRLCGGHEVELPTAQVLIGVLESELWSQLGNNSSKWPAMQCLQDTREQQENRRRRRWPRVAYESYTVDIEVRLLESSEYTYN
eukprot:gnl/TRDRNA2_/TRDRNA2_61360_c0_seq1.p1 gnl/TRDRNA2_/TRDRNA2_61360_c0~~gnl/TRDRNA2_/TRDRNA2_61360_c0_seq1.p1  ORF type:complete len:287 (+),score=59.91 gnl/TRDRNA2_/TRDRNA2_61360_c0_seq1:81-941(+)